MGGGDELICPFFTGQTLWWAILSTCVIIVVGLFLGFINNKYWPHWFEVATDTQQQGRTDNELDWKPKLELYGKALKYVFLDTLDIVQDVFFFQFLHSIAKRVHGIYFISFLTYFDLTTIILAQFLIGFFVARKYREIFNSEMKLLGNFFCS